MTKMTTQFDAAPARHAPAANTPVAVQILSVLVYGGFAIAASIVAIVHFWPAGIALAALLGWRGHFLPHRAAPTDMLALRPETPQRQTGNASFDAYRAQMMHRLEEEQIAFEGFLERLREAKDKVEFDHFLDDRAARSRREWDAANA